MAVFCIIYLKGVCDGYQDSAAMGVACEILTFAHVLLNASWHNHIQMVTKLFQYIARYQSSVIRF